MQLAASYAKHLLFELQDDGLALPTPSGFLTRLFAQQTSRCFPQAALLSYVRRLALQLEHKGVKAAAVDIGEHLACCLQAQAIDAKVTGSQKVFDMVCSASK